MSAGQWIGWLTVAGVLIVAGVYRIRKYGRAEGGEVTPLGDLMDGPEQVGDDTLAMVAEDNDGWSPCPCSEVDDTAAEADIYGTEVVRGLLSDDGTAFATAFLRLDDDTRDFAASVLADIDDLATTEGAE